MPFTPTASSRVPDSRCPPLLVLVVALGLGFFPYAPYIGDGEAEEVSTLSGERPGGEYTSSTVCAECHRDIYESWKNSLHARSLDDPVFYVAYLEAYRDTKGQAKYTCLRCHAPLTNLNGDFDLEREVTREGITCDFCHTAKEVREEGGNRFFVADMGGVKRGPLKDITSPAHGVEHSPLHQSAEFCAVCHEYVNDNGVKVMGTYSEWQESAYAKKGVQCQDCHMPKIAGKIVRPEIKEIPEVEINTHNLAGAHSEMRLKEAVKLNIREVRRAGPEVTVWVAVSNTGSGHMVPTGIPSRRLVVEVTVRSGRGKSYSHRRVYQKVVRDREGKEIERDSEVFYRAATLAADNRLRPGETRVEDFSFFVPEEGTLLVSAQVHYVYTPRILQEADMQVEMSRDERVVPQR